MANIMAGKIFFKLNGERKRAKGSFTYNLGKDKKVTIMGVDRPHGKKIEPTVPFIEGKITDGDDIDLAALIDFEGTVTLELANSKTIMGREMYYAADADVDTDEGEIPVRFESETQLQEV